MTQLSFTGDQRENIHAGHRVLMSIKPEFAEAILNGTKRIEFRKRFALRDVSRVVLYSTSPIRMVVGEFQIERQVIDSPQTIWNRYGRIGGIDRQRFFEYYEGSSRAVAIVIQSTRRYRQPLRLNQIARGLKAPQSFLYLN